MLSNSPIDPKQVADNNVERLERIAKRIADKNIMDINSPGDFDDCRFLSQILSLFGSDPQSLLSGFSQNQRERFVSAIHSLPVTVIDITDESSDPRNSFINDFERNLKIFNDVVSVRLALADLFINDYKHNLRIFSDAVRVKLAGLMSEFEESL
jgi:hypothetical protein